jgi:hypothetical protein
MRKIGCLCVLSLLVGLVPAMADTWNFSFNATTLPSGAGLGTFVVTSGVITGLTGTIGTDMMTLTSVGGFAGNDNAFSGVAPYFTPGGLAFTAAGTDYNLFSGWEVGCGTCIGMTANAGTPYRVLDFSATQQVPDGGMTLMMLGCALVGVETLRRKLRA